MTIEDKLTNEQAIGLIKEIGKQYSLSRIQEAFGMAIEALQTAEINCCHCEHYYETEGSDGVQGHCKRSEKPNDLDLISRQAAVEAVQDVDTRETVSVREAVKAIKALPSAEPKHGEWIPCSERLPEDDALVLVSYVDPRENAGDIWIGWHEMENVWYIDGEERSQERGNEVLAWMPLPEPYKESDTE